MPTAVILNNSAMTSWKVIGSYFRQNFEEQGVLVHEEELPTTLEGRKALKEKYPTAAFFHNTIPAPSKPLNDPACVPDVQWAYLGYRSDIIPAAKNIMLPAIEFSRIAEPWVELFNRYDELWVTTSHVGELLKQSGVFQPILRLPPALNRKAFPQKTDYEVRKGAPFKFLFVGEPIWRKGVHFLMYGFLKAFQKVGEAELVIKTSPTKDWVSLREDIKIITERLPEDDLMKLYQNCDCYISSSLAEGLGLPIAEAALVGLPICTNNWGGHRDLLTAGGYFPLDFIEADRPYNGIPQYFIPGQKCALSDENAVAKAMREIVKSPAHKRKKMAAKAREGLLSSYGAAALKPFWKEQIGRIFK